MPAIAKTREHAALAGTISTPLEPSTLAAQDAVIVVTDHDRLDWALVAAHAPLIVDTRDALRRRGLDPGDRLVLA